MKIAKYNHSCLVIEENNKLMVIDPGNYSIDALPVSDMQQLDYILITHEHQDHMDMSLMKAMLAKFPNVKIITNKSVQAILAKENITAAITPDEIVNITPVPHEKIWMGNPAENIMVTIFNKLSHPGDSLSFTQSAEVLALPVQAPWGSTEWAVETALKIKPKVIIPIHDWHWKDDVRKGLYQRLKEFFATQQIDFKPVETGEVVKV